MHHEHHQNVLYLHMNVIHVVSSSRGGPLKIRLPPGTTVNTTHRGKLKGLTNTAERPLPPPPPPRLPNKAHVYSVCGVPDITEKIDSTNRRRYRYREIMYVSDLASTIENLKKRNNPERNYAKWCHHIIYFLFQNSTYQFTICTSGKPIAPVFSITEITTKICKIAPTTS